LSARSSIPHAAPQAADAGFEKYPIQGRSYWYAMIVAKPGGSSCR
jgi:hypothetical protein